MMNDITKVPVDCVWEVTMGCNMRCMHCGSSCQAPLDGELSTEEALALIKQMKEVGLKSITLSGGEPTTRKDIFELAKALSESGVLVSMISNGWLITEDMIEKAIEAGITNISLSLDGLEHTHDLIRKKRAFAQVIHTLDLLRRKGLPSGVITTVNKLNLEELPEIWSLLKRIHVDIWQVQIALPMGNLTDNKDKMMLEPKDLNRIIEQLHSFMMNSSEDEPKIYLGDNIGYYNLQEVEIRAKQTDEETAIWPGCGAGKSGFGVLHNGDIVPCTSIREKEYIEGNIKDRTLMDMWKNGFKKFRNFSSEDLDGLCSDCMYSEICRGGCTNSRYCVQGNINSENTYCLYNVEVKQQRENIPETENFAEMKQIISRFENEGNFQVLNYYVQDILETYKEEKEIYEYLLNFLAYSYFRMELYEKATSINQYILEKYPDNLYALKGLGLSTYCEGKLDEGKNILYDCLNRTDETFMEPYQDLITILKQEGRVEESIHMLREAQKKKDDFIWRETFEFN